METSDLTVRENVGNVEVCLTANTTAAVDIIVHASTKQETARGQFLYIYTYSMCVHSLHTVCLCVHTSSMCVCIHIYRPLAPQSHGTITLTNTCCT